MLPRYADILCSQPCRLRRSTAKRWIRLEIVRVSGHSNDSTPLDLPASTARTAADPSWSLPLPGSALDSIVCPHCQAPDFSNGQREKENNISREQRLSPAWKGIKDALAWTDPSLYPYTPLDLLQLNMYRQAKLTPLQTVRAEVERLKDDFTDDILQIIDCLFNDLHERLEKFAGSATGTDGENVAPEDAPAAQDPPPVPAPVAHKGRLSAILCSNEFLRSAQPHIAPPIPDPRVPGASAEEPLVNGFAPAVEPVPVADAFVRRGRRSTYDGSHLHHPPTWDEYSGFQASVEYNAEPEPVSPKSIYPRSRSRRFSALRTNDQGSPVRRSSNQSRRYSDGSQHSSHAPVAGPSNITYTVTVAHPPVLPKGDPVFHDPAAQRLREAMYHFPGRSEVPPLPYRPLRKRSRRDSDFAEDDTGLNAVYEEEGERHSKKRKTSHSHVSWFTQGEPSSSAPTSSRNRRQSAAGQSHPVAQPLRRSLRVKNAADAKGKGKGKGRADPGF
ncbi:hypothetical protein NMY22_g7011 [Coprinellus aureogranulatus]|nr:hypothetical protein NMY22_g7011 [Coprinellus aureogranulatus]